jgi:hypothetical protein
MPAAGSRRENRSNFGGSRVHSFNIEYRENLFKSHSTLYSLQLQPSAEIRLIKGLKDPTYSFPDLSQLACEQYVQDILCVTYDSSCILFLSIPASLLSNL